jgi:DNA-binding NarL/FixJ family response regulator
MNSYNVLIIEDHPLIIEAYKSALLQMGSKNPKLSFNIDIAKDCDTAYLKMLQKKKVSILFF